MVMPRFGRTIRAVLRVYHLSALPFIWNSLNPNVGQATVFGGSGWPALVHAEADSLHQLYRHVGAGSKKWANVPPGVAGDAYMVVDLPACNYCLSSRNLFPAMNRTSFGLPQLGSGGSIFAKAAGQIRLNTLQVDTFYYSLEVSGAPPIISNVAINSRMRNYPPPFKIP